MYAMTKSKLRSSAAAALFASSLVVGAMVDVAGADEGGDPPAPELPIPGVTNPPPDQGDEAPGEDGEENDGDGDTETTPAPVPPLPGGGG